MKHKMQHKIIVKNITTIAHNTQFPGAEKVADPTAPIEWLNNINLDITLWSALITISPTYKHSLVLYSCLHYSLFPCPLDPVDLTCW